MKKIILSCLVCTLILLSGCEKTSTYTCSIEVENGRTVETIYKFRDDILIEMHSFSSYTLLEDEKEEEYENLGETMKLLYQDLDGVDFSYKLKSRIFSFDEKYEFEKLDDDALLTLGYEKDMRLEDIKEMTQGNEEQKILCK